MSKTALAHGYIAERLHVSSSGSTSSWTSLHFLSNRSGFSPLLLHRPNEFAMAEKIEIENAAGVKGDYDVASGTAEELTPAEDKRLLRKIDMW